MWQQNADAWACRLLPAFPLYADLLQPVALAVYEMRGGLSMLAQANSVLQSVEPTKELGAVLAQLMAFPAANIRAGVCSINIAILSLVCPASRSMFASQQCVSINWSAHVSVS